VARRAKDFYETPPWMTQELLRHIPLLPSQTVFEPCCGDNSITYVLITKSAVFTNDIDPLRSAHYHRDATQEMIWQTGPYDWVITNPPFGQNAPLAIVQHALRRANVGVAMMLRLSFLEPTKARGPWLKAHPPDQMIVMPRHSFTGNGKSDSVTTAWMIWRKDLGATGGIYCAFGAKENP
jgi:hypothetical protein